MVRARLGAWCGLGAILFAVTPARAQDAPPAPSASAPAPAPAPSAPPAQPAPVAQPAPAGAPQPYPYPYGYPYPYPYPYGYPPPPGYAYPQPQPQPPPEEMPYEESRGVPAGYHVDERVRKGPIIAGSIVAGVPYFMGVSIASARGFENHSYWLLVPGIGPLLTLATREKCDSQSTAANDNADCLGDALMALVLVIDGLMQTTGVVLLGVGIGSTKKVLVRDKAALHLRPRRFQTGYGLSLDGIF